MVAAENDCQSGNNKSQIGSGRASPALSSLRIQASVKSSFTLLGNEIQDTIGKQKTFLARHCVCALEVSVDFLAKGSSLVSVSGSSIDTSDLTLFPAVSLTDQTKQGLGSLYLGRKKALLLSILTALCFYLLRKTPKGYQYMGSHCSDNSVIVLSGLSTTILSFIESIAS
ncbi:hypothetical protein V6N13_035056 [Hibiscus sabdariffa]